MTIKVFLDTLNKKDPVFRKSAGKHDNSVHIRLISDLKKRIRVPQKKNPQKFNICDVAFAHLYEKTGDDKLYWFSKATNSNSIIGHKCISDIFHKFLSSVVEHIKGEEATAKRKREAKEVLDIELDKIINYLHGLDKTNIDLKDVDYIDETDKLLKDLSNDIKFQERVNLVEPIKLPEGKLPRPMPKKIGDSERYQSNPMRSKTALVAADFRCEFDDSHSTFISSSTKKPYMEAHHLIPMSEQSSQQYDIDVPENILCVCPTCHRKIHLAEVHVRGTLLKQAYDMRAHHLKQRGITIDFNALVSMYSNDKMT